MNAIEIRARLDPATASGIATTLTENLPAGPVTVAQARELDERLAVRAPAPAPAVEQVPGAAGSTVQLRRFGAADGAAVILWIHGGGMFLGSAAVDDAFGADLSERLDTPVVSVDYRLAPEHPYPAALDDCRTALDWCASRYDAVIVAGGSAGGGLAAALTIAERDAGGSRIAASHLYYPMLDDRHSTPSSVELAETPVWDRRLSELAWGAYLDGSPADAYAAPARAVDLSGLPPTYLDVGELDLFRDEVAEFAARLAAAGVEVEFSLEPGFLHAGELVAPDSPRSIDVVARRHAALQRDLGRVTA